MIHLWREYVNKVAVAECGAKLDDREFNVKARKVTCSKCMKTAGFRMAAKNPFWGVDLGTVKKPKRIEDPRPVKAVTCGADEPDPIEEAAFQEDDPIEKAAFGDEPDEIEKAAFGC